MDQEVIHSLYRKHNTPYIGGILFDSNCITPGTTFMYKLSAYLRPLLNTLKEKCPSIIFSDTSVPGEGEHKIIQHIKTISAPQSNKEKGWHVTSSLVFENYQLKGWQGEGVICSLGNEQSLVDFVSELNLPTVDLINT